MKRYIIIISIMVFAAMAVSGCTTVPKKIRTEVQGLNQRVDTLESRVEGMESKQVELEMAASEKAARSAYRSETRTNVTPKSRATVSKASITEIQTALKNANFYDGKIDGIKGKKTRRAIREFQKANGLNPDGVVGPKTWDLLSRYRSSEAGNKEVK
ncbi:MAG: hypothetical protein AUJ75_00740 [Candidatus Omnitrophica bacterium CG1_02_49_10]|nr:MAG: hypothetical protein AUJ75_00740 [Candidatus Omnitrophica bacterium CG1_02_49_10]